MFEPGLTSRCTDVVGACTTGSGGAPGADDDVAWLAPTESTIDAGRVRVGVPTRRIVRVLPSSGASARDELVSADTVRSTVAAGAASASR